MMSRQKVARFDILGNSYSIYDGMNIIGRGLEASVLIKDLKISKQHAIITVISNKHYITDFNSSNGCSLKDEPLIPFKLYEIKDCVNIKLGDLVGTYYTDSAQFMSPISKDAKISKLNSPKHINFAPTQQLLSPESLNKKSENEDNSQILATQLISNENNHSTISRISDAKPINKSSKIFCLLESNKKNVSNEVLLCNDSLNDNYDESLAKVVLEESVEVPCTQECFTRQKEESFNDSAVIPSTQDESFIFKKSTKNISISNEDDDDTDDNDNDTQITEDGIVEQDICISLQKLTPDFTESKLNNTENIAKNIDDIHSSDDEEIDLFENNQENSNTEENFKNITLSTDVPTQHENNTTKASSCLNDLEQNISENDLDVSKSKTFESEQKINKSNDADSIPETEEYEFNLDTDKIDFIPATQDSHETHKQEKKVSLQNDKNVKECSFTAATQIINREHKTYEDNSINEDYLAPTQILDTSQTSEFKIPKSIDGKKKNKTNESINDEDDVNFLKSTQEMMNNSANSESQSHYLDYYSSQEIDGIPEITHHADFEDKIFVAPTQIADPKPNQPLLTDKDNKESKKIEVIHLESIFPPKSKKLNETGSMYNDPCFVAPTQVLNNNDHTSNNDKIEESINKSNEIDFDAPTQKLANDFNDENLGFLAPTQKLDSDTRSTINKTSTPKSIVNKRITSPKSSTKFKDVDFSAPTQKLSNNNFDNEENTYFLAPTQTFMPVKEIGLETECDNIFLAPTQELMGGSCSVKTTKESTKREEKEQNLDKNTIGTVQNIIIEKLKDTDDSNDSDIIIKKKKPKMIKDTQEIVIEDSDSDSEIEYKRKKPVRIMETQEPNDGFQTQDNDVECSRQTLSNITKACANDSPIVCGFEDTEESIKLVLSNTSLNISNKSLNTSNKQDGETQLELNLPTEKEYFVSQNTRPLNPLVQVLDSKESDLENKASNISIRPSQALNMFVDLLNDGLQPTQINNEELEQSEVDIPDSDSDDYGEICEMETQPVGELYSKNISSPKTKIPKKAKTKTKGKAPKQTEAKDLFIEPTLNSVRTRQKRIVKKDNESKPTQHNTKKIENEPGQVTKNIDQEKVVPRRGRGKIQKDEIEVTEKVSKENKLPLENNSVENKEIPLSTENQAEPLNKRKDVKKEDKLHKEKGDMPPSSTRRNFKKSVANEEVAKEQVKRSTRGNSVPKNTGEATSSIATKRSTRAKSVTKVETEVKVDNKRSRRKTLATVSEEEPKQNQQKSRDIKEPILQLTPIDLKLAKNHTKVTEIIIGSSDEEEQIVNKTSRLSRNLTLRVEKETSKKNKRRQTIPAENPKQKTVGEVQHNVNERNTGHITTRKKANTNTISAEDKTPTKKQKIDSEDKIEFNLSGASSGSTPRRETRLRHKVVFTMLDDTNLEATISRLGGTIVNSSQECTVLVTSKISRSLKFLVAVGLGKPIVGPEWVRACGQAHKFLDPWDYILKDVETEKKNNFKLKDAILKGSNSKMLEGYTCLLLVNKNLDVLKNVIEACGGSCLTRSPGKKVDKNFIVISYPEDKVKYGKYLKQKPPVKVVGAEAIFAGALQQQLILDDHILK